MEILLNIAIPTTENRINFFNELYNELKKQCEPFGEQIEIIWIRDNKEMSIGEKRTKLNKIAKGKYVVHWDDDDWIHPNGINMIMEGIKSDCDVISYNYSCNIGYERNNPSEYNRKVSIKYINEWNKEEKILYVTPDPKNPVKKDILIKVPFRDTSFSEEYYFKFDLLPYLKTEYRIDEDIYQILNRSGESFDLQKRYNLRDGFNLNKVNKLL